MNSPNACDETSTNSENHEVLSPSPGLATREVFPGGSLVNSSEAVCRLQESIPVELPRSLRSTRIGQRSHAFATRSGAACTWKESIAIRRNSGCEARRNQRR